MCGPDSNWLWPTQLCPMVRKQHPDAHPSTAPSILRPIRSWLKSDCRNPARPKQSDNKPYTKDFRFSGITGEEIMLLPFPQDLPIEGVGILIDRLRGKPIPLQTALNAAWNLAGYAATQVPVKSSEAEPVQD